MLLDMRKLQNFFVVGFFKLAYFKSPTSKAGRKLQSIPTSHCMVSPDGMVCSVAVASLGESGSSGQQAEGDDAWSWCLPVDSYKTSKKCH